MVAADRWVLETTLCDRDCFMLHGTGSQSWGSGFLMMMMVVGPAGDAFAVVDGNQQIHDLSLFEVNSRAELSLYPFDTDEARAGEGVLAEKPSSHPSNRCFSLKRASLLTAYRVRENTVMAEAAGTDTGVSLGKGAWDCDNNCEIPPEKEVSQRVERCQG
jgi:hypothetical protein